METLISRNIINGTLNRNWKEVYGNCLDYFLFKTDNKQITDKAVFRFQLASESFHRRKKSKMQRNEVPFSWNIRWLKAIGNQKNNNKEKCQCCIQHLPLGLKRKLDPLDHNEYECHLSIKLCCFILKTSKRLALIDDQNELM